jgi:hypothetical protein
MTAECIAPIQGTVARIMREDECGLPVEGAGSLLVFDGFVQVSVEPQYEDGTTYRKRNAKGVNCVNRRGNDQFERDQLTIEFCAIDPDGVVITTGQELIVTGAPATGTGFWIKEGPVSARWSLEVWQADSDTCTGLTPRYAYHVWPHLAAGRLNSYTIEDDALEWSITAFTEKVNPLWAPPGVSPVPLPPPANGHHGVNITRLTPPEPTACGATTLTIP